MGWRGSTSSNIRSPSLLGFPRLLSQEGAGVGLGSSTMPECLCTNTHARSASTSSRRSSAPVRSRSAPRAMAAISSGVCRCSRRTRAVQHPRHRRPQAPAEPVAIHGGQGPARSTDCRLLRRPRRCSVNQVFDGTLASYGGNDRGNELGGSTGTGLRRGRGVPRTNLVQSIAFTIWRAASGHSRRRTTNLRGRQASVLSRPSHLVSAFSLSNQP